MNFINTLPRIVSGLLIGAGLCIQTPDVLAADINALKESYRRPLTIPFPGGAPYSPQIATLGKMLFFDPRLSGAQNMNCASCHNPSFGWETPVPTAIGASNEPLGRHAPTVLNGAWAPHFFWDGRAPTLEEQAAGPITASVEMNGRFSDIIPILSAIPTYSTWFDRLFPGEGMTRDTILQAIATYERTVVSAWSPFDRWVEGDETAISESAKRGFELFNGKAKCSACHGGWNFTDNEFHDIGLPGEDIGRAEYEPENIKARYAFKTPGLRNLTHRAPFMHDGSLPDLEAVLIHYVSGGIQRPSLSNKMEAVDLDERDINDMTAFLESLTAEKSDVPMPLLPN